MAGLWYAKWFFLNLQLVLDNNSVIRAWTRILVTHVNQKRKNYPIGFEITVKKDLMLEKRKTLKS